MRCPFMAVPFFQPPVPRSRRRRETHTYTQARLPTPHLKPCVLSLAAKTTLRSRGLEAVAARSRRTLAESQESSAGSGSSSAPRGRTGIPGSQRLRRWGGGHAPLGPPGGTARSPVPFLPRVLSSGRQGRNSTIKTPPSPLPHKVAPSRRGSGGRRGLGGAAQRAEARSRTRVPSAPHPSPRVHVPHGRAPNTPPPPAAPEAPAQSEAAHAALPAGRHPSSPPAPPRPRPRRSGPARPGHTHRPGRAVRAPLRSGTAFPGSALLRSGSRSGLGSRSAGLGSEMVAAAASEAGRACACVYVCARARGVCVCAGGPRAPLRAPLLPPVLHAAMPAESLTRAPTRPGAYTRTHTRTPGRAHIPAAAHPAPHSWGAHKGPFAPARRSPRSAARGACGVALRPFSWLAPPQVPGRSQRGPLGRPRSPTMPGPAAAALAARSQVGAPNSGFRGSPPTREAGPLLLACAAARAACSLAPFCPPFLSLPLLLSPLFSLTCSLFPVLYLSRCLFVYLAAALSRAPSSPPPCAASHILRITLGAARLPGPGFESSTGGQGTCRAPAPPPPPLSARFTAPGSGLAGGDVPR